MRYYKLIEDGYVIAIGTGGGGIEITEQEYNDILSIIVNKPPRTETTDFQLKEDLTWEEYECPEDLVDDELTAEQALDILMGGDGDAEGTSGEAPTNN